MVWRNQVFILFLKKQTSDIFGSPVAAASPTAHPNKPKDHVLLCEGEDTPDLRGELTVRPFPRLSSAGAAGRPGGVPVPQPTR